jgi:hypothetical protein
MKASSDFSKKRSSRNSTLNEVWALISVSAMAKDLRNPLMAETITRSPGNKFLKEEKNGEERNNAK